MYCMICKKHTREGNVKDGCGHYEPFLIFAERRKDKYILLRYFRLRSSAHRHWEEAKGIKFNTKEEAIDWAWKKKNNLLTPQKGD